MPLGGKDLAPVLAALDRNKRYIRGEVAQRRQSQVRARHALPAPTRRFDEAERIERDTRSPEGAQDLDPTRLT